MLIAYCSYWHKLYEPHQENIGTITMGDKYFVTGEAIQRSPTCVMLQ
jgi:hypothetical protein